MSSTTKDKKDKQLPDKRSMTTLPKLSNDSTNDKWNETKKRNLSSSNSDSTLSPKVQHKKKLFSSPNRFELLSAAETSNEDIIESQPTTSVSVHPANKPPPPIFIKGVEDFPGLCTELINLIGVDNFYCKSTTDKLKIQTSNPDSYRTVVHFLRKEKAEFHTYQLNEDKPTRVVLRNLHPSTPTELIKSELEVRLFEVRQVTQVLLLHRLRTHRLLTRYIPTGFLITYKN